MKSILYFVLAGCFALTVRMANAQCYTLSTNVAPPGLSTVTVSPGQNCAGGYTANTVVTLTANTPIGYVLGSWSGTGGTFADPIANPASFTITANASVSAQLLQQWYNAGSTIYTLSSMGVGGQGGSYPFRIVKAGTDWSLPNVRTSGYFAPPDEHSGIWIGYETVANVGIVGALGEAGTLSFWTHNGSIWGERMRIAPNGDVTVSGNINARYGQDIAEYVIAAEDLEPETVVVLDNTSPDRVVACRRAYDTRVAGVVSARPGIKLGEPGDNKELIATTGRVRVKVDASGSSIEIGDLLVTSDKVGTAMKSIALDFGGTALHRPGTILGKALEPLPSGEGEILVLLSLQ